MPKKPFLFLLGGADLEMQEIKNLLEKQGYVEGKDFLDKKLSWGAKLSDYQQDFSSIKTNVCIELQEDIPLPEKYLRIDHHGDRSHLPTSIEQIAELLKLKLSAYHQLVAANDKAYIPGMQHLQATEVEIENIRKKDRAAQGVSKEDEKLAITSIALHQYVTNGVTVVKALSTKFSPIVDRLFGKTNNSLLIYTDQELTYYGVAKDKLVEKYQDQDWLNIYSGGGKTGYFGIPSGILSGEKLANKVAEITTIILEENKIQKDQDLYSYHVFLFPFKWEYMGTAYADKTYGEKTNLAKIQTFFEADDRWDTDAKFSLSDKVSYNEYNYFYDFVREVIYDLDDDLTDDTDGSRILLKHWQYNCPEKADYCIELDKISYRLDIDSIFLHIYNTGVGVLSFHLNNRKKEQSSPADILRINQFGRRLYPPFLGLDKEKIGKVDLAGDTDFNQGLADVKKTELAQNIWIDFGEEAHENAFAAYENSAELKYSPFLLPPFMKKLLPLDKFVTTTKNGVGDILLSPILDDRMFVLCWYGNDTLSRVLKQKKDEKYNYTHNDWWYKYTFVDGSMKTCQNDFMATAAIESTTNARWVNLGTLYGASRYSFVMLSGELDSLREYNAAFLLNYLQTIYYKLVELVLIQRATILRFSDEITHLSNFGLHEKGFEGKVQNLNEQYIRFVNKIYFREITAQEQGIELYDLLQAQMRIAPQVKALETEINELNNYAMARMETKRNDRLELLTLLGTVFIVPAIITGFYGMNVFSEGMGSFEEGAKVKYIGTIILIIATLFFTWIIITQKNNTKYHKPFYKILVIIILLFLCFVTIYLPWFKY